MKSMMWEMVKMKALMFETAALASEAKAKTYRVCQ
ncbi:hypothetical protein PR003_g11076 [Phytophthora rubi]|uniref:Uncharacterized protein n=1 Tax=Phytophthora rubi TaxID=129364 RepID=A0A6A4F409_9STRA|nr:hypothetical protein PR003_g11076 [Phytophthora rubi]